VAAWLRAVLPTRTQQALLLRQAGSPLDGRSLSQVYANDLIELGLPPDHAHDLVAEIALLLGASGSRRTLYQWSLSHLAEASWTFQLLNRAPVLTATRIRYDLHPPAILNDTSYADCIRRQTGLGFWLEAAFFPYSCSITAVEAVGAKAGPTWARMWLLRSLRVRHLQFLTAILEVASRPHTLREQLTANFKWLRKRAKDEWEGTLVSWGLSAFASFAPPLATAHWRWCMLYLLPRIEAAMHTIDIGMSWLRVGWWPLLPVVLLCLWLLPLVGTRGEPLFAYHEVQMPGYHTRVMVAAMVICLVLGKLAGSALLARRR